MSGKDTGSQASVQAGAAPVPPVPAGGIEPGKDGVVAGTGTVVLGTRPAEGRGSVIGRYRLLEQLGEGGFGSVWAAEQREPVRRRVALKIIKLGMDTQQVVARFEAERQALALMDHPNIAKVLDAGATDSGRPYFVMELVKGIPITEYCDQGRLGTKDRLALFIRVCQAIQHAHQKGIIHRDIKPSNILVALHDGVPVPKVIDFGIAKATQQELTDKTIYTQFSQFIGTPAYMSPEQAEMSGLDIDTRSDIYSLGVLLYQLLTGETPFDGRELLAAGLDEMRRIIREREPVRPSTRLSEVRGASAGGGAPGRGAGSGTSAPPDLHALRGDLDWIVMKCLEKDRTRRYETASSVAADLQRHLNNEPVLARPPTAVYRFQKALRRHRLVFGAGSVVALALVVGLGISTWAFLRENQAYERVLSAEQEQSRLRAAAEAAQRTASQQRDLARARLYESLVREARSIRKARQIGYRREVFDRLKQAIALGTTNLDAGRLRREAAACLGDWVGLDPVEIAIPGGAIADGMTADGVLAAIARVDGRVSLYETRGGQEVAVLEVGGTPFSLAFDREGGALWVSTVDGEVAVGVRPTALRLQKWSARGAGVWARDWERRAPGFTQYAATPAGPAALVLEEATSTFVVLDAATDQELGRVAVDQRLPWLPRATLSGDRRQLAFFSLEGATGFDVQLEVWDLESGESLARLAPRLGPGYGLAFAPDGQSLAVTYDNTLVVYDTTQFGVSVNMGGAFETSDGAALGGSAGLLAIPCVQELAVRMLRLQSGGEMAYLKLPSTPISQRFSLDGSTLLLRHGQGVQAIRLNVDREKHELHGHQGGVPAVEFSPDGRFLASAGKDRTLRLWDLFRHGESRVLARLPAPGQTFAFSPRGDLLVCGYYNTGEISLWSTETGESRGVIKEATDRRGTTWACAISPDGKHLAAVGRGLRVWDLGRLLEPVSSPRWTDVPLFEEKDAAAGVVFDPSGERLAYLQALAWEPSITMGILTRELTPGARPLLVATNSQGNFIQGQAFLPKSGGLSYATRGREVTVLEPATGKVLRTLPALNPDATSRGYVANLRPSPDETKLAMVTQSGLGVDVRDLASGQLLYSLPEEPGSIWWLAWSPDAQHLAVSRANGEIAIWHLQEVEAQLEQISLAP